MISYAEYSRRVDLPIDNSQSWSHGRYQSIVNRTTAAAIFMLLCLLCAEVIGSPWGALLPTMAVAFFMLLTGAVCAIAMVVGYACLEAVEFFQGY